MHSDVLGCFCNVSRECGVNIMSMKSLTSDTTCKTNCGCASETITNNRIHRKSFIQKQTLQDKFIFREIFYLFAVFLFTETKSFVNTEYFYFDQYVLVKMNLCSLNEKDFCSPFCTIIKYVKLSALI